MEVTKRFEFSPPVTVQRFLETVYKAASLTKSRPEIQYHAFFAPDGNGDPHTQETVYGSIAKDVKAGAARTELSIRAELACGIERDHPAPHDVRVVEFTLSGYAESPSSTLDPFASRIARTDHAYTKSLVAYADRFTRALLQANPIELKLVRTKKKTA